MTRNKAIRQLFCRILQEIDAATTEMIVDNETEYGTLHIPNMRYVPTIEFTDEDIELIRWLEDEEGESFGVLTE